jgi:hypothetical protein
VVELVERLTRLAQITVLELLAVRTLNARYLKTVVKMILVDEGGDDTDVEDLLTYVQDKLDTYAQHLTTEKHRKLGGLDDAKRAEHDEKLAAQEVERKVLRLKNAKRSAFAAVAKSKVLTAELVAAGIPTE